MCVFDPTAARAVVEDVRRRVRHGEMFTAFDVSRAVRETGVEARHQFVRRLVHALYEHKQMGAVYTRTPVQITDSQTAFVYHAADISPRIYVDAGFLTRQLLADREG